MKRLRLDDHSGRDVPEFFDEAGRLLRRIVPFEGFCSLTLDPATLLPTSHLTHNSMRPEDVPRLAENEHMHEDFNKFAALARSPHPAGALSEATEGVLDRSARYREILSANGFGDELRLTAVDDSGAGAASPSTVPREKPGSLRPRSISSPVCLVCSPTASAAPSCSPRPRPKRVLTRPGLILLATGGTIEAVTPAAERWLSELITPPPAGGRLPQVVNAVAYRTQLDQRDRERASPLSLHGA